MVDVTTPAPLQQRHRTRTWAAVLAACVGQFLVVLDVSVVNVALPSMRFDLGMSTAGLQWVLNAYSIAFAGFMLLGGRAADIYGRKRMFLIGLGLFTAASLAGGLAQEGWQLLAGVGAKSLALIGTTVAAAGFGWQSTMGADGSYLTSVCLPGVLMMAGAGLAPTPLASLAITGAAHGEAGLVSGLVNTSRTMGGALGLAVLSTVAAARTAGGTGPEELTAG